MITHHHQHRSIQAFAWLVVVSLIQTGCHRPIDTGFDHPGDALKAWPAADAEQTLQAIRERDADLRAWRSQGTLVIQEPGNRVQLEVIILADRLDTPTPRLRMRATKLGRSVMDMVCDAGQAWLWMRDAEMKLPEKAEEALTRIPPLNINRFTFKLDRLAEPYFVFDTTWPNGPSQPAKAFIHRPTRTLHKLSFDAGEQAITLSMRYQANEEQIVPEAFLISLPEERSVLVRLESFETNPTLTDTHFKPLPDSRLIER